ncbi:MAG TPA: dienelactone hydrolase family protein [Anaerolineales bacterium]|nr:dienelactone hydrolase family protein [Anaerolineales bacterium]
MTALRWIGKPRSDDGVTEQRFDLERDAGIIPGILWTPSQQARPVPLVLMGHGGSGHKRAERQLLLGQRFARRYQIASVAIDGPFHGDRVSTPLAPHQYQERMAAIGIDKVVDGMIDDWYTTLAALSRLDFIDADRIAYIGFSMGARFGLPYVAAANSRLRCAVLGKYGMRTSAALNMAPRFTQDAPRITVPVLFHVQWDDELFPRDGQFELFDLLGARDKRLIAFPGPHNAAAPAAIQAWCEFITHHLAR